MSDEKVSTIYVTPPIDGFSFCPVCGYEMAGGGSRTLGYYFDCKCGHRISFKGDLCLDPKIVLKGCIKQNFGRA